MGEGTAQQREETVRGVELAAPESGQDGRVEPGRVAVQQPFRPAVHQHRADRTGIVHPSAAVAALLDMGGEDGGPRTLGGEPVGGRFGGPVGGPEDSGGGGHGSGHPPSTAHRTATPAGC